MLASFVHLASHAYWFYLARFAACVSLAVLLVEYTWIGGLVGVSAHLANKYALTLGIVVHITYTARVWGHCGNLHVEL